MFWSYELQIFDVCTTLVTIAAACLIYSLQSLMDSLNSPSKQGSSRTHLTFEII